MYMEQLRTLPTAWTMRKPAVLTSDTLHTKVCGTAAAAEKYSCGTSSAAYSASLINFVVWTSLDCYPSMGSPRHLPRLPEPEQAGLVCTAVVHRA